MSVATNLPLQDMIASVLFNATEKLADDRTGKIKESNKIGKVDKTKTAELTDPDYVEKLASAVDYIATNTSSIEQEDKGILASAIEKMSGVEVPPAVPAAGSAMRAESPPEGRQAYKKDKSVTEDAAESEAGAGTTTGGYPAGATQLANNYSKAPGQASGQVPKAKYPAKGPLVNVKHASVREIYAKAMEKSAAEAGGVVKAVSGAAKRYGQLMAGGKKSLFSVPTSEGRSIGEMISKRPGNVPISAIRSGGTHKAEALKSLAARAGTAAVAGGAALGAKKALTDKTKTASDLAREHILAKLAGEDVMKANISASRSHSPLVGGGVMPVYEAEQVPSNPTDSSAYGNSGRKHIQSSMGAIGYTKRDAKKQYVTKQMKEVIEEPAFNPKTDSKVNENLRNAAKGGVKIAAVKTLLEKIAAEKCTCDDKGTCAYCKMKAAAKEKTDKTKTAQMMGGGMGGGISGGTQGMGGMGAMAATGKGADGCTCGNAGECRVCQLKAAMAAGRSKG